MGGGGDGSHSVAFFTPSLPERLLSPQLRSDDSAGGDSGAEGRRAGRAGRAQSGGEEREEEGGKRGKGGRQKSGRGGREGGGEELLGRPKPRPRLLVLQAAVRLGRDLGVGRVKGCGARG